MSPQDPVEMVTGRSTAIATDYLQLNIGGDVAVLKGMMKTLLAMDRANRAAGGEGVFDRRTGAAVAAEDGARRAEHSTPA